MSADLSDWPESSFRELTSDESAEFRAWARENHQPGDEIQPYWHPIVRDECRRIDDEAGR